MVEYNPITGKVSLDYEFLRKAIPDVVKLPSALHEKLSDSKKRNEARRFLMYRKFLVKRRHYAAKLAISHHSPKKDIAVLNDNVPILYKKDWIPPEPIEIDKVKLEWFSTQGFDFDKSIFNKQKILPLKAKKYSSLQKKLVQNIRLFNDPTYRLVDVCIDLDYKLKFQLDSYYNYINTCELLAYEFSKELVECIKSIKKGGDLFKELKKKKFTLRDQIDPFDFNNRSAAVGINTIMIILNGDRFPKFFLHQRSKVGIAEGINTISVVPAGTFQPRHRADSFRKNDFCLFTNIARELAEEAMGKDEFRNAIDKLTDIFKEPTLKKINYLYKNGLIKVFFMGMGLDSLTTKPEMFTAMIFDYETIDTFFQNEFDSLKNCFEGKIFESEFSREQLQDFIQGDKMMPAGAACLLLAEKNYDFLCNL